MCISTQEKTKKCPLPFWLPNTMGGCQSRASTNTCVHKGTRLEKNSSMLRMEEQKEEENWLWWHRRLGELTNPELVLSLAMLCGMPCTWLVETMLSQILCYGLQKTQTMVDHALYPLPWGHVSTFSVSICWINGCVLPNLFHWILTAALWDNIEPLAFKAEEIGSLI